MCVFHVLKKIVINLFTVAIKPAPMLANKLIKNIIALINALMVALALALALR